MLCCRAMVKRKLIAILVSLLFAFAASEFLLRMAGYHYRPMIVQDKRANDFRADHAFEDKHFAFDPDLIWRPLPVAPFNSQSLRGRLLEMAPSPQQSEFIVAIGDSNTLGPLDSIPWTEFLEGELRSDFPGIKVANAGVYGYSSYQGFGRLQEILLYNPRMVLISFGANDCHQVTISDADYLNSSLLRWKPVSRLRLSHLLAAARDLVSRLLGRSSPDLVPRVSLGSYSKLLRAMIRTAASKGVKTVLLTRPFIGASPHALWWKNFAPAYNAETLRIAREEGVPVVDAHSHFEGKEKWFADESHFNADGHREMARLLKDSLTGPLHTETLQIRPAVGH